MKTMISMFKHMLGCSLLLVLAAGPVLAEEAERRSDSGAGDIIGDLVVYRTSAGDSLVELAREFSIGYVQMVAANPGIDPWVPRPGTEIILPKAHILPKGVREDIVINLPELRLYYFPRNGGEVQTFPLGVGRDGRETPLGLTKVVRKQAMPTWYPPESIRAERPELPAAVPPGPDNPLGEYALYFDWPRYLLHGTNKPLGVGRRVSAGCIRLYPEDIERFYPMVEIGTKVLVINEPIKLGWSNGMLYIEAHPSQEQADELEVTGRMPPGNSFGVADAVRRAAGDSEHRVDWDMVEKAVMARNGYPVPILLPIQDTSHIY